MSGKILVAEEDGVFLLKFEGDVRLTLCATIDSYLDSMFNNPAFKTVIVDLCDAQGIDSTALGVLAKLSIQVQQRFKQVPDLICNQPNIQRLLDSMGFEDVFSMRVDRAAGPRLLAPQSLTGGKKLSEPEMHQRVLEAHQVLMQLNSANHERFRDLVATLEASPPDSSAG